MWAFVFGGGTKIVIPAPEAVSDKQSQAQTSPQTERKHDTARMRWNYKLLGKKGPPASTSPDESRKLVRHELFIPPKMCLSDYFMMKVSVFKLNVYQVS